MLKENDAVRKLLNVDVWHKAGYTGKGVTIVLLDGEGKARDNMKSFYTDVLGKQKEIGHASNVGFSSHEFGPDAKALMFSSTHDFDEALAWVKANKDEVDLINVSLAGIGGKETPQYLAYEELGIPMICASGNDDYEDKISYPAAYDFTIAIGATNRDGTTVAGYSNEGAGLDAVVPSGVYIQRDDGYTWAVNGTSFASPTVCGMLSCYIQWRNKHGLLKLKPEEARSFIHNNCIDIKGEGDGHGFFCLPEEIPVVEKKGEVMETRPCTIKYLDFHHTAGHEANTEAVRKEHLAIGWGDIGYNMVIEPGGTIGWGRDVKYSGSHDPGPAPDGSGYTMNQKAYAISSIGNFDEDTMLEVQFQGLLKGTLWAMNAYKVGIDGLRRHKDQYQTACPGKNFPWDKLISEVKKSLEGGNDVLDVAILKYSAEDEWAAKDIDAKLGGVANFTRQGTAKTIPTAALSAKKLIIVGGPDVTAHPNRVWLSGNTKYDTAVVVGKYLG
jgi:hypothetical protein